MPVATKKAGPARMLNIGSLGGQPQGLRNTNRRLQTD